MFKVHHLLLQFNWYENFLDWTKRVVPPGFNSLPLYTIAAFFLKEVRKDALLNKASALAYSLMLAIFPGIIFLFTLIPYVPLNNFQDKLLSVLETVMPNNAYQAFHGTIVDIIKNQNGQLLSFGFLSAMYFATNGVSNLMNAFNKSSLTAETRSWLKRRWVALELTVLIVFSFIVCVAILILGQRLIVFTRHQMHGTGALWIFLLAISKWIIVVLLFFVTVSILYRYAPAHKQRWDFLSAGSIMATVLAIATSLGFSFYINHFSSYNKVYGSIGTLIVTMIFLYLNSLIVLLGFELNASIDLSKQSVKIAKPKHNTLKHRKEPVKTVQKSSGNFQRE